MLMRKFLNLFIAFHLAAILIWSFPPSGLRSVLYRPFYKYMMWMGLWQSWDMFSPNPLAVNIRVIAEITFKDGSKTNWEFPRVEKLGYFERSQKERYRKWRERIRLDDFAPVWDDTARYIARRQNRKPENPPVLVSLIRYWGDIPPPVAGDYQRIPGEYETPHAFVYKTYLVRPEDL